MSGPDEPQHVLDAERLDELAELDPGDHAYLRRAIGNFTPRSHEAVLAVRAGLSEGGDAEDAGRAAHKIAGTALNLGARYAGELARALDTAVRAGDLARARDLVEPLDAALADARAALDRFAAEQLAAPEPTAGGSA